MNVEEAVRWFKQAKADLESARDSHKTSHCDWACFQAQQAGEKALKAFLYQKGFRAMLTHSVRDLLVESAKHETSLLSFMEEGKYLDTFYIPSRYPNGLPGNNVPAEFYTEKDAEKCINCADSILQKVGKYISVS